MIIWISEGFTQAESYVHREFPRNSESTNLSRDNLTRDVGPFI